ncbi:uncharacterized protein K452DRAFT_297859 [Aplosporella prunicola CBS 121167]|uniref:CCHC-type domain-containing protein n=1 Tax=Aplosporella prunicola CBS 121167 TaxID=1176127 RepID=A0A6A6BEL2_9PEZI|nr:uncharacterized protein K452DRAFT_297859 [Aplosporella prunicola CBS 121167]KAF2142602.1 hypothetical protein K452DRAFT_297859 [Aplosporella prunicola CBS 121167]
MFRGSGRSRATPSTTCQKCLKKGHYSYECKASAQERPYLSRPSRTQQLFNPKLVPKLNSDVPNDLLRKKGVADEQLAKKAEERGRKHARDEDDYPAASRKRSRSASAYSSSSVSTISTNRSPSRSPSPRRDVAPKRHHSHAADDRKRRRRSVSSDAFSNRDEALPHKGERNTRRRRSSMSPVERGRRRSRSSVSDRDNISRSDIERSASPPQHRDRRPRRSSPRTTRYQSPPSGRGGVAPPRGADEPRERPHRPPPAVASAPSPPRSFRERSLSPYSKRLALTQNMGTGGR